MSAEKRKGDAFERDVVRVLNEHGHPYAERALRLGARDDRGDIAGVPGFMFDAKNCARFQLAVWMDELTNEARAYYAAHEHAAELLVPTLVVKRRGKDAEHAFAVIELARFAEVIA